MIIVPDQPLEGKAINPYEDNIRQTVPYYKKLKPIYRSTNSAILSEQLEYWFRKKPKGFYKYVTPPKNGEMSLGYIEEDSWSEELAFSYAEFKTAFSNIGTAHASKAEFDAAKDKFQGMPYCCFVDKSTKISFYYRNHALANLIASYVYQTPFKEICAMTREVVEDVRSKNLSEQEVSKVIISQLKDLMLTTYDPYVDNVTKLCCEPTQKQNHVAFEAPTENTTENTAANQEYPSSTDYVSEEELLVESLPEGGEVNPKHASKRSKPRKKLSEEFILKVREVYHTHKPDIWNPIKHNEGVLLDEVETNRIRKYLDLPTFSWSEELFLERLEKALKAAQLDFIAEKRWHFKNFISNGKVKDYAETWEAEAADKEAEKQALMEDMRSLHPLKRVELDPTLVDEHTIDKGGCLWKPPHEEKVKYYSFFEGELFEWYSPALCRAFWEFVNPYIEAGGITVDDSMAINPKMMLYFAVAQRGNLDFKAFRIQSTMYLTPGKEEIIDLKGLHAVTADETEIPVFIPREYWKGQHKRESARFDLLLASYRTHPRKVSQPVATA